MAHDGPWASLEGCWWEVSLPLTWTGTFWFEKHLPRVKRIGLGMSLSKNSCQWAVHIRETALCRILFSSEFTSWFYLFRNNFWSCFSRERAENQPYGTFMTFIICRNRYCLINTISSLISASSLSRALCHRIRYLRLLPNSQWKDTQAYGT